MSEDRARADLHMPRGGQGETLPAAAGIHLGLAIICASAIYTGWQMSVIKPPQWALMALVGAVLVVVGVFGRRRWLRTTPVRLLLALAGLLVLRLCYDPQLAAIPRLGEELPMSLAQAYPSVALIGVVIAVLSWAFYINAGGELELGAVPFRRAAVIATGLVVGLALTSYAILHNTHGLPFSETLRPVLAAVQGGGLTVVLLGIGGGPGVRRAPHITLGLTLILALVRNVVFPME